MSEELNTVKETAEVVAETVTETTEVVAETAAEVVEVAADVPLTPEQELKKDEILAALRSVIDPEIGLDVVELGLIRGFTPKEDENWLVTMILTTPFCPYGPQIIEQVRMAADSVTQGGSVVEMGTELWDPSMMEEGAGGDWGLF